MIALNTSTLVVYGLLTSAFLSIWLPQSFNQATRIPIWIILSGISAGFGLYYGIVELGGIVYLAALTAVSYLATQHNLKVYIRFLSGLAVIGLVIGLFLHKAPFFKNPLVFNEFFLSDRSSAYKQYWNFDKAAAGLILLAYFGDICRSTQDWKTLVRLSSTISMVTILLSLSLALIFGHIKIDITLSSAYFVWAWANLFFTCVSEEMLFRGFVQKHLSALSDKNLFKVGIVAFVGILFGLGHFAGGATYVILASIAGIGYGYTYHVTDRIESAVLTHFLLNSAHFLFFTYPLAKSITE
jgi:uncharacterized protein